MIAPLSSGYALTSTIPNRLLLTLSLGEMPEAIPSLRACKKYGVHQCANIDGGPIDRILRSFAGGARACRLHNSRTRVSERPHVCGARRYDEAEQISGVARVLRIEIQDSSKLQHLLNALEQVPIVESVSPDQICISPFYSEDLTPLESVDNRVNEVQSWRSRELVRLPQALGFEPGDPSVVIGLADTGVFSTHNEFTQGLRRGFDTVDLTQAMVGSLQLVGDNRRFDESPADEVGHGTGCAGILSAYGFQLPPGVGGNCGLTPVRVLGAGLSNRRRIGIGALSNIDAGMKRLIDLNVKVINMSFGTAKSSLHDNAPTPHKEVVDYALSRDVILVAASGNSGIEEEYFPAAHPGVIAVGAVDDLGNPCQFSTRGKHVTLSAPGKKIWTSGIDGYQQVSGTSFAAPFVAGVCALMASFALKRALPFNSFDAAQVLRESARPFAQPKVQGYGAGVLDALSALQTLSGKLNSHRYLQQSIGF
ncbi:S8 family serine peptidase [Aliikangiella sp. G2MR2-5]|uniref:S8 family peptidase n=1 Tax=Aliikangiella sp. G2MR2-5 TaxID=2788943 RepID=UPI0018AB6224|nr:S8 family serine peptidase [Aliikangiella sp. G2MR2-5]